MTVAESAQLDLPIRPRPARVPQEVPLAVIAKQPNRLAVIKLQVQASGLDEGQVATELGIDPEQWSRIMAGKAHFPTEKYHALNVVTGSHFVLLWDLLQEGMDPQSVRPLMSDVERQLVEKEARIQELERELTTIADFVRRTGAIK